MTTTSNFIGVLFHVKHAGHPHPTSTLALRRREAASKGAPEGEASSALLAGSSFEIRLRREVFGVRVAATKHAALFPYAQSRKYLSEHVLNPDPPDNAIHCGGRAPKILGDQFRFRRVWLERLSQRLARVLKTAPVPFERQ
jgi:hypothetical protein